MDTEKKIEDFLSHVAMQKEAGLIILSDSASLETAEKVLKASHFKETTDALEALTNFGNGTSVYVILRSPIAKELYDVIVQYSDRGGMIQVMDKAVMKLHSFEFDPNICHLVLLVLKESLEMIEKTFAIREKVGMTEQI